MVNFLHDSITNMMTLISILVANSNTPESPAYGDFVSQLIRYARIVSIYEDFLFRGSILFSKLLKDGYSSRKLQTTFRKLYGCYTYLVPKFDTSVTYDWFPVMLGVNRDGCHMWGRKCSSGTPDFTPFGKFIILLIRYIYIIYH